MNEIDGIFYQWVNEAKEEVSLKGWRDVSVNALLLLCHDMSTRRDNRLERVMRVPIRWFMSVLTTTVIWVIVRDLFI